MFKQLAVLVLAALALSVEAKHIHSRRSFDNCEDLDVDALRATLNKCEEALQLQEAADLELDDPVISEEAELADVVPEEVLADDVPAMDAQELPACVEAARRSILKNRRAALSVIVKAHAKRRSHRRAAARRSYHH